MSELLSQYDPEVLVIAAPPMVRLEPVAGCPNLKAVLCEKPLGSTIEDAKLFLDHCDARNILVQVNLWRRCDDLFHRLATGHLQELIGRPQTAQGVYGNGLLNNGTHVIDMCRMMFGEVVEFSVLGPITRNETLPLANDFNVSFSLTFRNGMLATLQALDFRLYREIGMDIWGENGRLELMNEGLTIRLSRRSPHRALLDANEVAVDAPETLISTVGNSLYRVYDNLAAALRGGEKLLSSGTSAWSTAVIVDTIRRSAETGQRRSIAISSG
jgi:predicted dehydrogenase